MAGTTGLDPFGVAIVPDEDFTVRGFTDVPELERETAARLADGSWSVYGVHVVRMCDAGEWHPDYGHALWGIVVETTADAGGVITDPQNIGDDWLREVAGELLTAARAAGQDGCEHDAGQDDDGAAGGAR